MASQASRLAWTLAVVGLLALSLVVYVARSLQRASTLSGDAISSIDVDAGHLIESVNLADVRPKLDVRDLQVKAWHRVDELDAELAQLPTVFWEPDDTASLRQWMAQPGILQGRRVLEIGPGTGLLSLVALRLGARDAVAIDVNPYAVINTAYNAERLGFSQKLSVKQLVDAEQSPFALLSEADLFDFIISNPPWEDSPVTTVDQYALYDPGMRLCDRLLQEAPHHLTPGGKILLVYGARSAIQRIIDRAPQHNLRCQLLDPRPLATLPEVFVPGILIELTRE